MKKANPLWGVRGLLTDDRWRMAAADSRLQTITLTPHISQLTPRFVRLTVFKEICTMFTGIVEAMGVVKEVISSGSNRTFWIDCPLAAEFRVDQSVSHSGVCLTVEEIKGSLYRVTAIEETLKKTDTGDWISGTRVNIERCLPLNGRLDGHFVQGHVDTTGICLMKTEKNGSWEFEFEFPASFASLIIEKGSIAVNGISLTAFGVKENSFTVAIIPFTYTHTNIGSVQPGNKVNLEFDLIGKYLDRRLSLIKM